MLFASKGINWLIIRYITINYFKQSNKLKNKNKKGDKLKKKFKFRIFEILIVSLLFVSVYSCSDDDDNPVTPTGPDAKTINGKVTFVDTNFILNGGTYLISAYPSTGWPPTAGPSAYDTIKVTRTNNVLNLNYNYKLKDLNPGEYVVSVGFRKTSGGQSPIMGIYGCDTLRAIYPGGVTCLFSPSKKATIGSENQGTAGIDFLSWSDTTKKIY